MSLFSDRVIVDKLATSLLKPKSKLLKYRHEKKKQQQQRKHESSKGKRKLNTIVHNFSVEEIPSVEYMYMCHNQR